jgi:predicted transcriptional regulator
MASITTLKLPEDLMARIVAAAEHAGKSPHALMVEALAKQTEMLERRREFIESALAAAEETDKYGLVYEAEAVNGYFRDKLAGKPAKRPKPVKLSSRRRPV